MYFSSGRNIHQVNMLLCDAIATLSVAVQQVLVLCLCRNKSVIVIAGVANTLPVMLWLMYIIHVTLRENEEDAQNAPKPVRISEFFKVNAMYHRQFPVAVCFTLQDYVVSSYINLV